MSVKIILLKKVLLFYCGRSFKKNIKSGVDKMHMTTFKIFFMISLENHSKRGFYIEVLLT